MAQSRGWEREKGQLAQSRAGPTGSMVPVNLVRLTSSEICRRFTGPASRGLLGLDKLPDLLANAVEVAGEQLRGLRSVLSNNGVVDCPVFARGVH